MRPGARSLCWGYCPPREPQKSLEALWSHAYFIFEPVSLAQLCVQSLAISGLASSPSLPSHIREIIQEFSSAPLSRSRTRIRRDNDCDLRVGHFDEFKGILQSPIRYCFSTELAKQVQSFLQMLSAIMANSMLNLPFVMCHVLFNRLPKFLQLQTAHPHTVLVPPADIQFVWWIVLLDKDLWPMAIERHKLGSFPHCACLLLSAQERAHAKEQFSVLWRQTYPSEDVYLSLSDSKPVSNVARSFWAPQTSPDTYTPFARRPKPPTGEELVGYRSWCSVLMSTITSDQVLQQAQVGYQRYLYLCAKYPEETRHAQLSCFSHIRLFWLTHLAQPEVYRRDCLKLLRSVPEQPQLASLFISTDARSTMVRDLWREEFKDNGELDNINEVFLCFLLIVPGLMSSRSASHLKELIGFLRNPHPEVRRKALRELKGFTGDAAGKELLKSAKAYEELSAAIFSAEAEATEALSAVINLTEDEDIARWFITQGVVSRIAEKISDKDSSITALYLMLMANLTRWPEGSKKFLQTGEGKREGIFLAKLLVRFMNTVKAMESSSVVSNTDSLAWQAQILQNVSQVAEGRKLFAERGKGLISRILPLLPALRYPPHLVCRRSILGLVRNCAFEDSAHEWLVKDQQLMTVLAIPLLRPGTAEKYIEEDRTGMPGPLVSAVRSLNNSANDSWCEHDRTCQKLILETLFLLAKSLVARNYYRSHKLYPVLREFHATEGDQIDEAAIETIGKLVECCVCDEGPENLTPKPPATVTAPKGPVELPKGATSTPIEVKNVLHLPSSSTTPAETKKKAVTYDSDDEEPQVEEIV